MKTKTKSLQFAGKARSVLAVIFLLAAVGLAYEIALTRVFSVLLQYQSVFLIVSMSIMGLSVGAAASALWRRDKDWDSSWATLTAGALLTSLLLIGAAVIIAWLRSADLIALAFVAALLPFIGIGFLNSRLFATFAQTGGVLYAVDLLGATTGLVVAFIAIGLVGAFDLIPLLSLVTAGAASVLAGLSGLRRLQLRALAVMLVLAAGIAVNRGTGWIAFSPGELANASPDKTLIHLLGERGVTLLDTRWDPFARLDMVSVDEDSIRYIFTDAGAGSIMIPYDGDNATIDWILDEVEYLPFAVIPSTAESVLIIGAGAGRDVLMAKLAGLDAITAVEINPTLVEMTRDYAQYNGAVLDLPGVQTIVTDGRNYIERSDQTYDLIYGNVVYSQAAAPGHSALSESYIFTREALQSYWRHLTENGSIAFATHQGVEGIRLVVAALDMLENEGMTIQQALQHVAFGSRRTGDVQTRTSVVIIRRQPWTPEASSAFADAAHAVDVGTLYLPGVQELGLQGLATGATSLEGYIAGNADLFNYAPTTDDSPFFYQFTPGLPSGLSDLLLISVFAAFAYLSWVVFFFVRPDGYQWKRATLTPYFAVLGAAYLLIEIPLIQRFSLLLGQPTLALPAVIGAMLLGSGLGSLFSSRFPLKILSRRVTVFALLVAAGVILSQFAFPAVIRWALPMELPARLAVTVLAIMPLGFLMGVPFPSGLRIAHEADSRGIAAFWGANAVMSVVGSSLAMAMAVSIGFSAALLLGAALYAAAAALAHFTWPRLLITT